MRGVSQSLMAWLSALMLLAIPALPSLRAEELCTVMNVGDSISRREHLQRLQEHLIEAGVTKVRFVGPVKMPGTPHSVNRMAYGGATLEDLWSGRTVRGETQMGLPEALATYQPRVVLLMAGINNVVRLKEDNLSKMESAWKTLVDEIHRKDPETWIIVGSVTPVHREKKYAVSQPTIDRFNQFLRDEVLRRRNAGARMAYAPTGETLTNSDFQADGLHPAPSGDAKIAAAWFHTLLPLLSPAR